MADETGAVAGAHDRGLLLIAAKAPVPGQTKTRLGASIGMERAAALSAAFLVDLAARFTPAAVRDWGCDVGWAYTPAEADFRNVLMGIGGQPAAPAVRFVPQWGEGWDVRQQHLLRWGWQQGYGRTVLIASDSPQLSLAEVGLAFTALETHDVALARTLDGGYSLIGMRGCHDVLTGVPMSTVAAADGVAARVAARGLRLAELAPTFDVDTEDDLDHLRAALAPAGAAAPATWATLRRLGLARPLSSSGAHPARGDRGTGAATG